MKIALLLLGVTACYSNHGVTPDGSIDSGGDAIDASTSGGLIARSFDGEVGMGLAACQTGGGHCDRPEMNAAANGTQVVQVTSRSVNVYDYSGMLLHSTPLAMFITDSGLGALPAGKNPIEPHVVYDEFIQRWIVTATGAGDCLIASASSDASGSWGGIYIDNYAADPSIHLAYDKNGVYLSEVQPNNANPNASVSGYGGVYFAIPSAEMQWVGTFAPAHKNRAGNMPIDGMPSTDQTLTKAATAPAMFMSRTCNSGGCQSAANYSFSWLANTVTWSGTTATYGPDQVIKTNIGSTQNQWLYNTPVAAIAQAGTATTIRPIESHRLMNVVQTDSHLYAALGSGPCTGSSCGAQGADTHNLALWVDLDCTTPSACVVSQTGKIADPNEHLEFATVGATQAGNLAVVAATVGAATNPSIRLWTRAATDTPNTVTGPVTIMDGTQPDTCVTDPVSFGNAVGVGTERDPLDQTKLWTTHQYSNSAAGCTWATRIVELAP